MPRETESYSLILLHPQASMLLAEHGDDGSVRLPQVAAPVHTRLAEEVNRIVDEKWGLKSFALFRPTFQSSPIHALVLTLPEPPAGRVAGLEWTPFSAFATNPVVELALRQLADYEQRGDAAGFYRRPWFRDLETWVRDRARRQGIQLTGRFRQLNCSATFALIRFETDQGALWFKATGEPNRHEFAVMRELLLRAPEFSPRTIAFHEKWNGWLMREAPGEPIDICNRSQAWVTAARSLAQLQMRFCNSTGLLRRIGFRDFSLARVSSELERLFEDAQAWMGRQPAGGVSQPLAPSELNALRIRMSDLLAEFSDLGIPETLVHGDLNPGNIIISPGGCIFLDWSEAWICHPFVAFEYLAESLRKTHPASIAWLDGVRSAFAEAWHEGYSSSVVDRAFRISPAVAALVYTLACAEARCPAEASSLRREPLLRSMIRRVAREAREFQEAAA